MHPTTNKPDTSAAATDVGEFVTDLDGGRFDHMLSVALSKTAAAVVDRERKGEVTIKLNFERIKNTTQVRVTHTVKFTHPTELGKATEDAAGATVMHVGRFGKLSLTQPRLPGLQSEILG